MRKQKLIKEQNCNPKRKKEVAADWGHDSQNFISRERQNTYYLTMLPYEKAKVANSRTLLKIEGKEGAEEDTKQKLKA